MKTTNINTTLIDGYFGLIKNLSPEIKLGLIEKLTKTLKVDLSKKNESLQKAFGAWQSNQPAEVIIDEIRANRNFNRQLEAL
jgi:hypothetical protein